MMHDVLPSPPWGLAVESIEVNTMDGPRRRLGIRTRGLYRRVWFGALGVSAAGAIVAHPGLYTSVVAAAAALNLAMFGRQPRTLWIETDRVEVDGVRHDFAGVTAVQARLVEVALVKDGKVVDIFKGSRRQVRWVASVLRQVLRSRTLPVPLLLPAARVHAGGARPALNA